MREACTRHGEFKRRADGTLEFDDYIELRRIIVRQTSRTWKPIRTKLEKMKSDAYMNKDNSAYIKAYHEMNKQANSAQIAMTMKTCEHIELDPPRWQGTDSRYTGDERMR